MNGQSADGADITLSPEEAAAVEAAAGGYAAVLPPGRAAPYHALAQAAAEGVIPADLVEAVERVAAVSLQTGQARRGGQAGDESLLAAVYRRTPAGRALAGRAYEVNQALEALTGRQLRAARVSASAPGSYRFTLQADGVTLTLTIDTAGIEVRSLHAG